jgi:hypothetical protein
VLKTIIVRKVKTATDTEKRLSFSPNMHGHESEESVVLFLRWSLCSPLALKSKAKGVVLVCIYSWCFLSLSLGAVQCSLQISLDFVGMRVVKAPEMTNIKREPNDKETRWPHTEVSSAPLLVQSFSFYPLSSPAWQHAAFSSYHTKWSTEYECALPHSVPV